MHERANTKQQLGWLGISEKSAGSVQRNMQPRAAEQANSPSMNE